MQANMKILRKAKYLLNKKLAGQQTTVLQINKELKKAQRNKLTAFSSQWWTAE